VLVEDIEKYLKALNRELLEKDIRGEIGIVGGAAMCLAFKARAATKDVDAIFEPTKEIRDAAKKIANEFSLSSDWLNDAVKAYLKPGFKKKILFELSNLSVWTPEADYLLAMKAISARWDSSDRDDVLFLIRHLRLKSSEEVFRIIEDYYPRKEIPSKTHFFIDELFDKK